MSISVVTDETFTAAGLFAEYSPLPCIFDEMEVGAGRLRPHWQPLVRSLEQHGRDDLASQWDQARRTIREHGVTYNIYSDPRGMSRPWQLDPLPLLVPQSEWSAIEDGLIQRSKLFNLILTDVYGPQTLLAEGAIPPALVFGSPFFLRPCHGSPPPRNIYLHLLGSDIARSPDGQWWVISDRTQAPSGMGYALENRIVLSRIFADEFKTCKTRRLASFFRKQREMLRSLAPANLENPNVVLLTPGPYNETYFEHAYLARYLGFTLVEGGDLTVRNRRVFIKTLEGLQPVDVILRRVDDTFCDPLELRGDSFLGVAGLVEAVRAGNVAIANALGSGLIESPAFLAFLPSLCERLLGERLKLPSVATWWCGQKAERQYVTDNLEKMVIKPAFGTGARTRYFGGSLGEKERAALLARIADRPHEFVGQEHVTLSTTPVWMDGQLQPRPVVVRTFVSAYGDSYTVMAGGLARVSTAAEDPIVSMQSGGGSKDTWVLSDVPVNEVSLLSHAGMPIHAPRTTRDLPSRVADNLFWLGRYVERLEETLRLLRCVVLRVADETGPEISPDSAALARMMADLELLPSRFERQASLKELEQELNVLIYSPERTGSVAEILGHVRNIASVARDRFSVDTWSILNQLRPGERSRSPRFRPVDALPDLNTLILTLAAFSGVEMENMTRGLGWRFLDMGRRLERAWRLVRLLRATITTQADIPLLLEPVLEIADSTMTHRRRYFSGVRLSTFLELLLVDEGNPRALAFQFEALAEHAAQLPAAQNSISNSDEKDQTRSLAARLRNAKLALLMQAAEDSSTEPLQSMFSDFEIGLGQLSGQLTQHYFNHTVARVS